MTTVSSEYPDRVRMDTIYLSPLAIPPHLRRTINATRPSHAALRAVSCYLRDHGVTLARAGSATRWCRNDGSLMGDGTPVRIELV